ncbi:MAG: Transposase, partial [Actinomycetota bacterium]|nr:Transposase [Actinomycetota bacterium]
MFIIGIDPHKGSHTAAVIDRDEQLVSELSVQADRRQRDRLLRWAAPFAPRLWAVEGATGVGAFWRSNSLVGARLSWMCPRCCRHGRGCWTRAATTRPTVTTRGPRR